MKKQQKKTSRPIVIASAICGGLVAILIFTVIFTDVIVGRVLLSRARDGIDKSDTVVLSDPSYNDSVLPTSAEAVLTGEEAKELAERVLSLTDDVSFHNTKSSDAGFWDISLRFESENDSYTVYLWDDGVYVVKNNQGYLFKVDKNAKEEYTILSKDVRALITRTVQDAQK